MSGFAKIHHQITVWAQALCLGAGIILLVVMGIGTVLDILLRSIGYGIPGIWEIVTLAMRWMIGLALPYAFCVGAHITIDVFTDMLPARLKQAVIVMAAGVSFAVMLIFSWRIIIRTIAIYNSGGVTSDLSIPTFYAWLPLALGISLAVPAVLAVLAKETANCFCVKS